MTVSYSLDVSTSRFGGMFRLMGRWRGSIYKLVVKELSVFMSLYYFLLVIDKYALNTTQRKTFHKLCEHFHQYITYIPLQYVLGFFVTMILSRWWMIFDSLPWIDPFGVVLSTYIQGDGERCRMYRRTMVRYANVSVVLCLRSMSSAVMKRFPTLQHLVDAKLLTADELKFLESHETTVFGHYYQPVFWTGTLATNAMHDGYLADEHHYKHLVETLNTAVRSKLGMLMAYDWVSVPLVYTQVVIIAVHAFFLAALFGTRATMSERNYWLFEFCPIFSFLQFVFLMGWFKVAEVMLNPMGEDDDDFELNFFIDRNIAVGFEMVDLHNRCPLLTKDPFWDETDPMIPYTEAAADTYISPFLGSAAEVTVSDNDAGWADEVSIDDNESVQDSVRRKLTTAAGMLRNRKPSTRRKITRFSPNQMNPQFDTNLCPDKIQDLAAYVESLPVAVNDKSGAPGFEAHEEVLPIIEQTITEQDEEGENDLPKDGIAPPTLHLPSQIIAESVMDEADKPVDPHPDEAELGKNDPAGDMQQGDTPSPYLVAIPSQTTGEPVTDESAKSVVTHLGDAELGKSDAHGTTGTERQTLRCEKPAVELGFEGIATTDD